MAKQKKNSNYVTEKTTAQKAQREEEKAKAKNEKEIKLIAIIAGATLGVIALILGLLFAFGAFEYVPDGTEQATITLSNSTHLDVELFGNDAPETVEHFEKLLEKNYLDGKSFFKYADGKIYFGSTIATDANGIKGEFKDNGVDNKVPMKAGTIVLARGEGKDSGYGQFFILTEDDSNLDGKYTAFGKISSANLQQLIEAIEKCTIDAEGNISDSTAIKITDATMGGHSH